MEGLFYSFDLGLELSVTLGALVAFIAIQSYMIIKRTRIKREKSVPDPSRAADVIKTLKHAGKKPTEKPVGTETFHSGVFKKFETNLKRQAGKSAEPAADEEQDVIVSLSSKSATTVSKPETVVPPPKPAVAPETSTANVVNPSEKVDSKKRIESLRKLNKSIKVDPIGNLFDDVKENLELPPNPPEDVESAKPDGSNEPIAANEFLTSEDLALRPEDEQEGIDLVLTMATRDYEQEKYEESLSTVRQFLQSQPKQGGPTEQMIRLIELKADNEFKLQQYDRASQTLQEIVTRYITRSSPDFLPLLEKYSAKFKEIALEKYAIHFMFTALNEYRQLHDHVKMDQTYEDIETAYRQNEDWPRLVQTYQNHLTIKKALKDYSGQLELLDHLGKLLYDQGEADKSRKCYKQRLVVENQMGRSSKNA